jgi:hypothetical protein
LPVIPLYDTPANPHAWHRVTAPGGYERWHLRAADERRGVRVEIDLFDGDPFNPDYVKAYERYRRRPTRVPPPLPRDFPRVRLGVDALQLRIDAPQPPGTFYASQDGSRVRLGPCSIHFEQSGVLRATIESPAGELLFRPRAPHAARVEQTSGRERGAHYHVMGSPAYDVTGMLGTLHIEGTGELDHRFGTGPTHT